MLRQAAETPRGSPHFRAPTWACPFGPQLGKGSGGPCVDSSVPPLVLVTFLVEPQFPRLPSGPGKCWGMGRISARSPSLSPSGQEGGSTFLRWVHSADTCLLLAVRRAQDAVGTRGDLAPLCDCRAALGRGQAEKGMIVAPAAAGAVWGKEWPGGDGVGGGDAGPSRRPGSHGGSGAQVSGGVLLRAAWGQGGP